MSENEIKPVAWVEIGQACLAPPNEWDLRDVAEATDDQPLYDQSAIDRLTAERDAAVADAERYRFLRDAPTEIPSAGVEVAIWDDGEGEAIRGAELDAAIDAARAEGGV